MAARPSGKQPGQDSEAAGRGSVILDPYRVLKVSKGASAEEIREAFEAECMRCHPGKLNGLGDGMIVLARRKAEQISRAYELLMTELDEKSAL